MSAIALGMALRFIQSIFEGAPTLLIGVMVAGVFRHMLGADGTRHEEDGEGAVAEQAQGDEGLRPNDGTAARVEGVRQIPRDAGRDEATRELNDELRGGGDAVVDAIDVIAEPTPRPAAIPAGPRCE